MNINITLIGVSTRNEISPLNEFEKKYRDSHYLMIEQIVYGTDVSNSQRIT